MLLQSGPYMIIKGSADDGPRLTLNHDFKVTRGGFVVTVQSPIAVGQKWILTAQSNGNYTIASADYDSGLSKPWYLISDNLHSDKNLVMNSTPFEWRIQPSRENDRFHIVVPGGPIASAGGELAVDQRNSGIEGVPPVAALRPLDIDNIEQAWLMVPVE